MATVAYTRQAVATDIPDIMTVINAGIAYLKEQGSPQWQYGHGPNEVIITNDIKAGFGHVLVLDDHVVGYGALVPGPEPAYEDIKAGSWLITSDTESKYVAIHRIAIDTTIRGQGLAKTLFHDLVVLARARGYIDQRVDTYPANEIMQKVISKAGFTYRGMIQFNFEHGERKAYQLIVH